MLKSWSILTPWEKIAVAFLVIALLITGVQIGHAFIEDHSTTEPQEGGVYIEGAVGKLGLINPLYTSFGSISHDITHLVFSALTKYNPATGEIVPDLAEFQISRDKKEYTFILKKDIRWHDGTPLTSQDILFTYNDLIKNPDFNGAILNYIDYSGVKIVAVDSRTVTFTLEQPDSFFLVKTMTPLLPKHLLAPIPIKNIPLSQFNESPIGSGPYRLIRINSLETYTEVSLEAFPDYYGEKPHITTLLIKIFPDFDTLFKKQGDFMAIHNVPYDYVARILKKGTLAIQRYQLPQYVAVFINTEAPILKNKKVRLALQLATDKKSIIESVHQTQIIDTPLLEIDQENWVHQYNLKRANGSLFETEWQIPKAITPSANAEDAAIPEKIPPLSSSPSESDKETLPVTYIRQPNEGKDFETQESKIVLSGVTPPGTQKIIVNDYELRKFDAKGNAWSYTASPDFGNLQSGDNIYRVYALDADAKKTMIDAIRVRWMTNSLVPNAKEDVAVAEEPSTTFPLRHNNEGKPLVLNLITNQIPIDYAKVATLLKDQWRLIGVDLNIEVLTDDVFQERVRKRQYDLLLFGQNLGYNLDAYPYWHSSQAKESGYNLSQFKNFAVDSLLEKARVEYEKDSRQATLSQVQTILSSEIPAIFLYSPTYYFALSPQMQNVLLKNLATNSDRFAQIHQWYARIKRTLKPDTNVLTFPRWLIKQF